MSKTYEDGLNDAWKAARRICAVESGGGLPADVVRKLFGNGLALVNFSAQEAIKKRELIKVRVLQNCMEEPEDAITMLAERADVNLVQIIGRNGLLFKRNYDKPKIELP